MCDEVPGARCEHVSDIHSLRAVSSSNKIHSDGSEGFTDMFAPPILHDHATDFHLSQSVACTLYLGTKLGFAEHVPSVAKSVQHLNDLQDLNTELTALEQLSAAAEMPPFVEGGRLDAWLDTIERSIVGPWYYAGGRS